MKTYIVKRNGVEVLESQDSVEVEKFLKAQRSQREKEVQSVTGVKTLYTRYTDSYGQEAYKKNFSPCPELLQPVKFETLTVSKPYFVNPKAKVLTDKDKLKALFAKNVDRIKLADFENFLKSL